MLFKMKATSQTIYIIDACWLNNKAFKLNQRNRVRNDSGTLQQRTTKITR